MINQCLMPIKAINMLSVVLDSENKPYCIIKGIKLSLCLIKHHGMWGSVGISPDILTFGTIGDCDGPTLYPGSFTSGELSRGKHWRGVRMDPRAGLDTSYKTDMFYPLWE